MILRVIHSSIAEYIRNNFYKKHETTNTLIQMFSKNFWIFSNFWKLENYTYVCSFLSMASTLAVLESHIKTVPSADPTDT